MTTTIPAHVLEKHVVRAACRNASLCQLVALSGVSRSWAERSRKHVDARLRELMCVMPRRHTLMVGRWVGCKRLTATPQALRLRLPTASVVRVIHCSCATLPIALPWEEYIDFDPDILRRSTFAAAITGDSASVANVRVRGDRTTRGTWYRMLRALDDARRLHEPAFYAAELDDVARRWRAFDGAAADALTRSARFRATVATPHVAAPPAVDQPWYRAAEARLDGVIWRYRGP